MARIERRTVLQFAALAAATPWVVNVLRTESAAAGNPEVAAPSPGVDAAFAFLDGLVPLAPPVLPGAPAPVASRSLPRSYSRGYLESIGFDVAFSYDCALVVLAYLARGTADDVQRATTIGDVLVSLQESDPELAGRIRNSYIASVSVDDAGRPQIASHAATTGNQAWVGIALLALHATVDDDRFLVAALTLARAVVATSFDDRGLPAFSGGRGEDGRMLSWRSTEHNTDCYAFFSALARVTADQEWADRAADARTFVESLWRPEEGYFLVGTIDDGVTPNVHPIAEDAQTWTYLALRDPAYAGSLDWAAEHLAAHDGDVHGVTVCHVASTDKVWLEGTAHLAAALTVRATETGDASGDLARAAALLDSVWVAQASSPHADGLGIPSASSDDLDSGFGDLVYASLHTGSTAWAILAALGANPLAVVR
jgi:hypothetical protein